MSNPENAYFVFISNLNSTLDMLITEPIYKTKFRVDPLNYDSIKTAFDLQTVDYCPPNPFIIDRSPIAL